MDIECHMVSLCTLQHICMLLYQSLGFPLSLSAVLLSLSLSLKRLLVNSLPSSWHACRTLPLPYWHFLACNFLLVLYFLSLSLSFSLGLHAMRVVSFPKYSHRTYTKSATSSNIFLSFSLPCYVPFSSRSHTDNVIAFYFAPVFVLSRKVCLPWLP